MGDTLERVLAESSSLPLGAVVMLSDGSTTPAAWI